MSDLRRDLVGGAVQTALTTGISSSATTITINSATGWPAGSNGPFYVVIDPGLAGEEKVLCLSRSGTTLTVVTAPVSGRGADGTSASTHSATAIIYPCLTAVDLDSANDHIYTPSRDDHTNYLTTARHDITARHQFGAALGTPSAAADVGTTASAGTATVPARSDHGHKLAVGAVNSAGLFVAGVVDSAAIAASSVTSAKILDGTIVTADLADSSITSAKIVDATIVTADLADSSVTSAKIVDGTIVAGDIAAGAVTDAKISSLTAWTAYTPTVSGAWSKGNGTTSGRSMQIGKTMFWHASFVLGSTSTMNGQGGLSLPTATSGATWSGTCMYVDTPGGNVYAGMWTQSSTTVIVCKTTDGSGNTGARADTASPFAFASGDEVHVTGMAEVP